MLHVFTKEILVYQASVNVKFSGVMKIAGTVKIRGVGTFRRCKSREGGYRVSYGSTLTLNVLMWRIG